MDPDLYSLRPACVALIFIIPPDLTNLVKIFKGQRRFALSELVHAWNKTFPPDHFGHVEINDSIMLREKPVPHNLVRRIRSCSVKSLEQDFKYL